MKTLYLDPDTWSPVLNSEGGLAVATDQYRIAQDVATSVRVFLGECFYDTTRGVPYTTQILDVSTNLELVRSELIKAAELIESVYKAEVYFTDFTNRSLSGQIQITDTSGSTIITTF